MTSKSTCVAFNILIGERTAEQIKIAVGSALTELDNPGGLRRP